MKRILTAIVLIPLVLLVLFKAPLWLFSLAVGAVALAAAHEYLALLENYQVQAPKMLAIALVASIFIAISANQIPFQSHPAALAWLPNILAFASSFLFLSVAMRSSDLRTALLSAAGTSLVIPYVAQALASLVHTRAKPGGVFLILYLFAVVWSGDIFAYYVGRAIGKNKLAPRISPGKTWEGATASLIGSAALGVLMFTYSRNIMEELWKWHLTDLPLPSFFRNGLDASLFGSDVSLLTALGLSLGVNIAAQVGDLVESVIKRGANVKDSGTLLPGHGGVLDRIDALLFAAPVVYFYAMINSYSTFYSPK
jgi:phosphatidate cytidylyltransferase